MPLNRRRFLQNSAHAGLGFATLGVSGSRAATTRGKLRVLSIGVVGTIGATDRRQVASHPDVEITGLCDVDSIYLSQAAIEHPHAFTCCDYRDAFDKHLDKFDAVIVSVPDHSHAPIMLTAMAHDKHVYGQKPLVHQLEELSMIERAIKAKPNLVTQLGNQRMAHPGRRAAVEILRQGQLGRVIEAYSWVGAPAKSRFFNFDKIVRQNPVIPPNLDWDLWLGPCAPMAYHDCLAPEQWRSWWDFGTNGLGDWGCHVLDIIFFSYDELQTAYSVKTDCEEPASRLFHVNPCKSTITYQVESDRFAGKSFPIHFYDMEKKPSLEQLRIPEPINESNMTVVVCEDGTLSLEADGRLKIWREGKMQEGLRMPGLPKFQKLNHWHAWVENCLGRQMELRAPFQDAVRISEAVLLAVKATRFPGQELIWNKSRLAFTNNPEASQTIVRRQYREGFAPPPQFLTHTPHNE